MKNSAAYSNRSSGIALVIVLTMLVLLAGLIVSFMMSASTEAVSSKSFSDQMEARQAADAAVNYVIGQIRDATTNTDDGASPDASKTNKGFTWVSQPGAITAIGANASTLYKLYSADDMRIPALNVPGLRGALSRDAEISLVDSDKLNEVERTSYVDLNEPAMVPVEGGASSEAQYQARYPIVDPHGSYSYAQASAKFTAKPTAAGTGAIEGFYCEDKPHPGNLKDADGKAVPTLPMRVKWLYILKDGSFARVDKQGKIIGATKANPPVARTGFWTDDDSSKLNINTASEGSYWDVPSVGTRQESGDVDGGGNVTTNTPPTPSLNLAVSQPGRNEFQRYPGHPATTSLSPAVRWLFPAYKPVIPTSDVDLAYREAIYRMAPRVVGGIKGKNLLNGKQHPGTSQAGTVNTDSGTTVLSPIESDRERLFATVDEYFFRPDRSGRDVKPVQDPYGGKDVANPNFVAGHVEKLRFFLTANSRSPELNLFGKPRVTSWPAHLDPVKQTKFDDLFQFCSTLGRKAYFFQRQDPLNMTADYSTQNKRIYKYLQDVTQRSIPWLGKSFLSKYQGSTAALNRDQVLTEIFDYIRCTNLVDTSDAKTASAGGTFQAPYTPFYWGAGAKQAAMPVPYSGQVVPLRVETENGITQGFGRFITVAEAALVFYKSSASPAGQTSLQAVLVLEMFTPAMGFPALRDTYSVRLRPGPLDQKINLDTTNLPLPISRDDFQVMSPNGADPKTLNFFTANLDSFSMVTVDAYTAPVGRVVMPFRGFANQLIYDKEWDGKPATFDKVWQNKGGAWDRTAPKLFERLDFVDRGSVGANKKYPFYSDPILIPAGWNGKFKLKGGTFIVDIFGTTIPGSWKEAVQTIRIKFPDGPTPSGAGAGLPVPTSSDFKTRLTAGINSQRSNLDQNSSTSGFQWIQAGDTIRSMEVGGPTKGDHRLVAALPNVGHGEDRGKDYYAPRGGAAYNGTAAQVHGLRMGRGGYYPSQNFNAAYNSPDGKLAKNVTSYRVDRWPRVPVEVNGVTMKNGNAGDWDRGISKNVDGAFINHSDEGNQNFDLTRTGGTRLPYFLGFSGFEEAGPTFFSPNRLMPSPVVFGSLPSRAIVDPGNPVRPWETLLFRPPILTGNSPDHEGFLDVPDHLYLDLFHMPVVEPYAISEPFSTAGKVNLNYEIAPFGYVKAKGSGAYPTMSLYYLERKTALYGVLRSMKMLAVDSTAANAGHTEDPLGNSERWRFHVDRKATVALIQQRLEKQGVFKTASEICEIPMVPEGAAGMGTNPLTQNWTTFWEKYSLTGDNQRERPYAHVYPRLTTRSNVFTVYVRAQAIQKNPNADPEVFDEKKDRVASEYRGQVTIERYVDPSDPALQKYDPASNNPAGSSPEGGSADRYYRFRIVNTRQFSGK